MSTNPTARKVFRKAAHGVHVAWNISRLAWNISHQLVQRTRWLALRLRDDYRLGRPANIPVEDGRPDREQGAVEEYWTRHTVRSEAFLCARQSAEYLEWRFDEYPLFREFFQLWGAHDGQVLLDYGCGPGNDTTGFLLYTNARQVIAMDVSPKSLELSRRRLMLHRIDPERVRLMRISDVTPGIPVDNGVVDHINCGGVLHHTSDPESILKEFARVLRPGGTANIMVYNRDSIWRHLYVAYTRMVVGGELPGRTLDEAFTASTDGPDCPISRSYSHAVFLDMCRNAGLDGDYVGGYLSRGELWQMDEHLAAALEDSRLGAESREFLARLEYDDSGLPLSDGWYAGAGGTYRLRKPDSHDPAGHHRT